MEEVAKALPIMQDIFADLERVAGLGLNEPKCILIPLWPTSKEQVNRVLARHFPYWADMTVDFHGTYLGVVIGPGSRETFWNKAVKKYLDRARQWSQVGLGLLHTVKAYCTYILPVLCFLAQFRKPSEMVLQAEKKALDWLAPGPYRWCLQEDYYQMGKHYGQTCSFPSVSHSALAARTRLYCYENYKYGGLNIDAKYQNTRRAINRIEETHRYSKCFAWFSDGTIADIFACRGDLQDCGLDLSSLKVIGASPGQEDRDPAERDRMLRNKFQRVVRTELAKSTYVDPIQRFRAKLDRWKLPGIPAHTASKLYLAMRDLKKWATPRICSAVLRTSWNGWCTKRRFQKWGPCCLGCDAFWQEDSIEHYAKCPISITFARNFLRIRPQHLHIGHFVALGLTEGSQPREEIMMRAIWVYALYKTHNMLRYKPLKPGEEPSEMLKQFAREGVMGHAEATACLDNRWTSTHPAQEVASDGVAAVEDPEEWLQDILI